MSKRIRRPSSAMNSTLPIRSSASSQQPMDSSTQAPSAPTTPTAGGANCGPPMRPDGSSRPTPVSWYRDLAPEDPQARHSDRRVQASVFLPQAPGDDDGRVHRLLREPALAALAAAQPITVDSQRGAVRSALSDSRAQSRHRRGSRSRLSLRDGDLVEQQGGLRELASHHRRSEAATVDHGGRGAVVRDAQQSDVLGSSTTRRWGPTARPPASRWSTTTEGRLR